MDPLGSSLFTGLAVRTAVRDNLWRKPTAGLAPGFVQANLVILPQDSAFDFLRFCLRNPKPCPILDVLDPGSTKPLPIWGENIDIRTDVPRYRVYRDGALFEERSDLCEIWQKDWVTFLIGCSFTFEEDLVAEGIPLRHVESDKNVPMYRTNINCAPAGRFSGPLVVSMRPIPASLIARAVQITARFPSVHGAPVHIGSPEQLGISHIQKPDYGDAVDIYQGEIPVFWACGVTPQAAAVESRLPFMITHAPGYMLVLDRLNRSLSGEQG